MPARKKDAAAELAEKLTKALEGQRRLGGDAYPLTLRRLAELTDPAAPPDLVLKASAKKKPFGERVLVAKAKALDSPVALAEDLEPLAASPLLLEFVLNQVCTPASPTYDLSKLKTKVPAKLKQPFVAAVQRHVAQNTLPPTVAVVTVKKKPALHLLRYPLPRLPEVELAEKLVSLLRSQRALGTDAYPLALGRLVELTRAPEKLLQDALKQPVFTQGVLLAVKSEDQRESPVALAEDGRLLAESPLVLAAALKRARSDTGQVLTIADVKKKVNAALQPSLEEALLRKIRERSLPPSVGCLLQKNKPVLFLMSDVNTGLAASRPPVSVQETPPRPTSTAVVVADFPRLFEEAFRRLEQQHRTENYVSLLHLRQELATFGRATFDAELRKLRQAGQYTLNAAEGRHGLTPQEQDAGIVEDEALLLHVSRKLS